MKFVIYYNGDYGIEYLDKMYLPTKDINNAGIREYSTCRRFLSWIYRSEYWNRKYETENFGIMQVKIGKGKMII